MSDGHKGIVKESLTIQVYENIRRRILQQELKPGASLGIRALADEYGTSATPVREALRLLSKDHLVEIIARSGSYVSALDTEHLGEYAQMRIMIEAFAVKEGIDNLTGEELARLTALVEEMNRANVDGSVETISACMSMDREFHTSLVRLLKNPLIENMYEAVHFHIRSVRLWLTLGVGRRLEQLYSEHRAIVDALAQRDPERAQDAVRCHAEMAMEYITRAMQRTGVVPGAVETAEVSAYPPVG